MGQPALLPCTPQGVIQLLRRNKVSLEGREAVVLGRSNLVGKPMAQLLLRENATVTVCHSRTRDLPAVASRSEEHTSELQSRQYLVCRLLLEKKKTKALFSYGGATRAYV